MRARRRRQRQRRPQQRRSRQTVDAVLDAVALVLKKEGVGAVTTNRIAEVAGVSIGSVYQYFPDKRAIFIALHERHVEEVNRAVEAALLLHASAPLETLLRALVDVMVGAHTLDPELHQLLFAEVPHRAEGERDFEARLHNAFRLVLAPRVQRARDLDRVLFVITNLIESLSHAAVLARPKRLSLAAAKEETVQAALSYLRAQARVTR